jgi:TolB protein
MRPTPPILVVAACSLGPLCACTEAASDVRDADSAVEAIVYTTLRPPNLDIWLFEEPGSEPVRLTDHPALDYHAAFSPDGRWMVFTSERSGSPDLYALELDGAGEPVRSPAVRPDGRITFTQPRPAPGMDALDALRTGRIVSVAPDGSDLRLESDTARSYFGADIDGSSGRMVAHGVGPIDGVPVIGNGLAFSPPGADRPVQLARRTVEVRGVRGYFPAITPAGEVLSSPLHLAGARPAIPLQASALDGSDPRDVFTPESGMAWGAAVAGDIGDVVVAVGPPFAPGEAGVDIWRVRLDDGHATNRTAGMSANDALPHVSPDGRRIVFRSGGDGSGTVHIMDGEGRDRRRLTDDDAIETMPALSRDGEWVVFPTNLAGGRKLRIQRVDGSEARYLEPDRLDIPDFAMHPRFSPDGDWIVFTSDRGGFNDEWPLTWFPQPYGDLWAVPVAGGEAIRLTHNKWEDGPSDWGFVQLPAR